MSDSPLDQARRRHGGGDFVGEIRGFCDDPSCVVGLVTFRVREIYARTPRVLRCPACASLLRLKRVMTLAEANVEDER